jgi:hypothetical protein
MVCYRPGISRGCVHYLSHVAQEMTKPIFVTHMGRYIHNLLFKSCSFAPQCLRKTEKSAADPLIIYIIY